MKTKEHHLTKRNGWYYFQKKPFKFSLQTTDREVAVELRDKYLQDIRDYGKPVFAETTEQKVFGEVAVEFVEDFKRMIKSGERKPGTLKNYRFSLNKYILEKFGNVPIEDIKRKDIIRFRKTLPASTTNVENILTPMRSIMSYAIEMEYLKYNPFNDIKGLSKQKPKNNEPFILEEVFKILECIYHHLREFYQTLFFTGARFSEIAGLKRRYVRLDKREIEIAEAYVKGETVDTKTDGSNRIVKLNKYAFEALLRQMNKNPKGMPNDYVFLSTKGNPLHPDPCGTLWRKAVKKAGLIHRPQKNTRHTFISNSLRQGENSWFVAKQCGHVSLKQINTVYSKYIPSDRDGDKLEKAYEAVKVSSNLPHQEGEVKTKVHNLAIK